MKTVLVPTFDEFNKYAFVRYEKVKIKNKPDFKDVNKIGKHLPGIPMGGCGRVPLKTLLTDGRDEVRNFYDARQNTKMLRGYFVTLID